MGTRHTPLPMLLYKHRSLAAPSRESVWARCPTAEDRPGPLGHSYVGCFSNGSNRSRKGPTVRRISITALAVLVVRVARITAPAERVLCATGLYLSLAPSSILGAGRGTVLEACLVLRTDVA